MIPVKTKLIPLSTVHATESGRKIFIRKGIIIRPTSLTIHSTANLKSNALNERNWLVNENNKSGASWNICVDEKEAIIAIPLNEKSNHAGSNEGNMTSIGLEICESGNREKTLINAIEVSAWILKTFGLTSKNLKQHHDWNGKNCPRILRDTNEWKWFVKSVKLRMEADKMLENLIDEYGYDVVEKALKNLIEAEKNKDVIPEWAKSEYDEAVRIGITDGTEPQMYATRCEAAIMIKRASEK